MSTSYETATRDQGDALWPYLLAPSATADPSTRLVHAKGSSVKFADGVEALCARSGLWNVNFGYGNQAVNDAVTHALNETTYLPMFRTSHDWAIDAANALVNLKQEGAFSKVVFSTSGSAANDAVMKLARHWAVLRGEPNRNIVVGLRGSYHGQTYGSIGLTGEDLGQKFYRVDQKYVRHIGFDDNEELDRFMLSYGPRIAAIVVEPVLGSGTVPLPESFLSALFEARRDHGFVLVADEVATGFFRTGPRFASDLWAEQPDVMVLSKGLTNGTCGAAAILVSDEVYQPFKQHDSVFVHGETQGGSPSSCAAINAVAALSTDAGIEQRAKQASESLTAELEPITTHRLVSGRRGVGCFQSLLLCTNDGQPAPPEQRDRLIELIRQAGCWVYPGPFAIQVIPPVVTEPDEISAMANAIASGLDRLEKEL